jgi:hypothetical protein
VTQPRTRHVFVKLDHDPIEHPGLVHEWARTDNGWNTRVTYVVVDEDRAVMTWVQAHHLRPVVSEKSIGSAYG